MLSPAQMTTLQGRYLCHERFSSLSVGLSGPDQSLPLEDAPGEGLDADSFSPILRGRDQQKFARLDSWFWRLLLHHGAVKPPRVSSYPSRTRKLLASLNLRPALPYLLVKL